MSDSDPNFNPQNYQGIQYQMNNQGFNSASALAIRLDFITPLENFQMYLRGVEYKQVMGKNGKPELVQVFQGTPIVNDNGYQAVMSWYSVINAQVVQGNFIDENYLNKFMMYHRKGFYGDMMTNRKRYGIAMDQILPLTDRYSDFVYPVLTRCLFNKEREGMNNTIKVQETMNSQTRSGGLLSSIPFLGGKK